MNSSLPLPEWCGIAFKEWWRVCEAIGDGRQSLILRKGGIAEAPEGFVLEHSAFWLYPTHVHEAQQGLRIDPRREHAPQPPADRLAIGTLAVVESVTYLSSPEALVDLEEFHVWTRETILKRFEYRRPGLWVLVVRAFHAARNHEILVTAEHAGCKSWVPIEPPLSTAGLRPVLDDSEFSTRRERLESVLKVVR